MHKSLFLLFTYPTKVFPSPSFSLPVDSLSPPDDSFVFCAGVGVGVGVAFGVLNDSFTNEGLLSAISIAIGIGLQNFPEGAAVSLPLRREGFSRSKAFILGQASGIVEPISGIIGAVLVTKVTIILPFALSFAAGTMILVAVHELIPECQQNKDEQPYTATMGIISGFATMMLLDVMLG